MNPIYGRVKRAFDIAGASLGLLLTSPVIVAIAVAIRLAMGRPILFLRSLLRLDRLLGGFRGSAHPNSPPFRRLAAQHGATFKAGAWNFC